MNPKDALGPGNRVRRHKCVSKGIWGQPSDSEEQLNYFAAFIENDFHIENDLVGRQRKGEIGNTVPTEGLWGLRTRTKL